ncbi:hypothetical protein N1851_009878 [Merluccius polli]|uniref:Tc1-like transposase DDE domain-containing protein n=1 Tax=Merluccius polli TaxID=89951 RepID=A0AA47MZ54_MERPO|nr:hypothetical protein N1851_009878 [Merluccius polli]
MKQLYNVPFERNSERVKETHHQYVQAGFNLAKGRRRGRNRIGQRATIDVPGQRGGNVTMCAAISENGVLTHIPLLGPYNTQHLLTFLDTLYRTIVPENERGLTGDHLSKYVVVWDVSFHHSHLVRVVCSTWQDEEFFSAWRWKVYDQRPYAQMALLAAMDAACDDITVESCRGWIRHSRRYFPRCLAREDIRCDVDENMWPDRQEHVDVQ